MFGWSAAVCVGCGLVLSGLPGCRQETPSGYHTFREKQSDSTSIESADNAQASPADGEPLTAELQREEDDAALSWDVPASAVEPLNIVDGSSVADILRVVPGTAASPNAAASPNQTAGPRKVELLIKQRDFRPEGAEHALRVTYDDLDLLKILNMDPVTTNAAELMPDWLRQLDGKEVRVRGFMRPTFESTGLEQFVMARDAALCCFGANPKVYDLIAVEMKPGTTCDYIHLRPFDVVGKFKIDPLPDGDKLLGLYWIEDAKIVQK